MTASVDAVLVSVIAGCVGAALGCVIAAVTVPRSGPNFFGRVAWHNKWAPRWVMALGVLFALVSPFVRWLP